MVTATWELGKAIWLEDKKKLNTYQSWKIGSEEKGGGAKHWRRIAHNKHHFPEIVTFSSIKIMKITIRTYHYQRGLLPAKSFTGTNTQKNSSAECQGAHRDKPVGLQIHQSAI